MKKSTMKSLIIDYNVYYNVVKVLTIYTNKIVNLSKIFHKGV